VVAQYLTQQCLGLTQAPARAPSLQPHHPAPDRRTPSLLSPVQFLHHNHKRNMHGLIHTRS
jgi:hypothetical protein